MALRMSRLVPSLKLCLSNRSVLCENNHGLLNYFIGRTNVKLLHSCRPLLKKEEFSIVIERNGTEMVLKGKEGDSVLDVVVNNEVDLGGYGACEGTLSCSTCHVILQKEDFSRIPDRASDEELDMLDLAPDVCGTSRLGCQIYLCKEIEGLRVKVPSEIKDMREFSGQTVKT